MGNQAFILPPEDLKHLTSVFRWYASKARAIHVSESDSEEKARRFADLYDSLRAWKSGLKGDLKQWAAAAWTISSSSSDLNTVGAFSLRVFTEEIVPILAEVYQCKEMMPRTSKDRADDKGKSYQPNPTTKALEPKFSRVKPSTFTACPKSIALVNIKSGFKPEDIGNLIQSSSVHVIEDHDRPLPALRDVGLFLTNQEGERICDIADADIPTYRSRGITGGDVVTFRNSLKVFFDD
jgi:hypothetical protein